MAENQTVKYLQTDVNMLNMNNKKRLLIYFLFSFCMMLIQAQTTQKKQDGIVFTAPSNAANIKKGYFHLSGFTGMMLRKH